MNEQLTLWEEVTPARREKPVQGRYRAPERECAECGKKVGRRWKEYVLCRACQNRRDAGREPLRDHPGVCGELPHGLRRLCCGDPAADCQTLPF